MRPMLVATLALAGLAAAGPAGAASGPTPIPAAIADSIVRAISTTRPSDAGTRVGPDRGSMQPLLLRIGAAPAARHLVPLDAVQLRRLRAAQQLHAAGQLDRARDSLIVLDGQVPHHPLLVSELAQIQLDREDFLAVERLGRAERAAMRDSLILGREMALALERLGRPRDAAQIALEVWAAAPAEAPWAGSTIARLAPADARGIREIMRRAIERMPDRTDLRRGAARVAWETGDPKAALAVLAQGGGARSRPSVRWLFADEVLSNGSSRDTTGALEALAELAGDRGADAGERQLAARRAWDLAERRDGQAEAASRLSRALQDLPPTGWDPDLLVGVARGLRASGRTAEARALLATRAGEPGLRPELSLERALADLRDGPPAKALAALAQGAASSPEAHFRYAEALFFAGMADSALVVYQEAAKDPNAPFAGAALERIYLIEEAQPRSALPAFGRLEYEAWRGNRAAATAVAESLFQALPRGALWAQAAVLLAARREAAGDARGALLPLLAVADSLPGDRLAPLARQRAGDLYLNRLKDEAKALAQYEECLARYPRAWNAAEVRRVLEKLRRERRF